jgi:hypothetical protein
MAAERTLEDEVAKHFQGTPEERLRLARELGRRDLERFLATLPAGTTWDQARRMLARAKHRGRRPSKVMESGW